VNGDELVSLVAVGLLRPLLALTAFGRGYSYIRCSFSKKERANWRCNSCIFSDETGIYQGISAGRSSRKI
jgi:hypothetical protein